MNIRLYIGRLILDGLPIERNQGPYIQAAVEAELARLLTEHGLATNLESGGAVPSVNANTIKLNPGTDSTQLGHQIAHSVYSGIGNIR